MGVGVLVGFGLGVVGMGVACILGVVPVLVYLCRRVERVERDNTELLVWNTQLTIEQGVGGGPQPVIEPEDLTGG